jgi:hypothetical protein
MGVNVNGFAVLGAISSNPDIFKSIKPDACKAATALVLTALKEKSLDLAQVRKIHRAVGAESFDLVLDGMKDAQLRSLLKTLDKHQTEIQDSTAREQRDHLDALILGATQASPAPAKKVAPKSPRSKERSPSSGSRATGTKSAGKIPPRRAVKRGKVG